MVYSYNGIYIYAASENEWTLAIHIQELNLINILLSGNNEKIPHKVQHSLWHSKTRRTEDNIIDTTCKWKNKTKLER